MDINSMIRYNFWDMFDTDENIELNIDRIIIDECSPVVSDLSLIQKFDKMSIHRDSGSKDLEGTFYFKTASPSEYNLYWEYVQDQTGPLVNFKLMFIQGTDKIEAVCTSIPYCDDECECIYVKIKKITVFNYSISEDEVTEYYLNAPDANLCGYKKINLDISMNIGHSTVESAEKLIFNNQPIASLPEETFLIDGKRIDIWVCDSISERENTLGIRYHWQADEYFRKMFTDFISFLLGRRMIKIAEKICDRHVLKTISYSFCESTMYLKQRNTAPYVYDYGEKNFAELINRDFSAFRNKYEEYQIPRFLTLYWHASTQSKSVATVLYQMSTEVLVNAYSEITDNKYIISKEEMKNACGSELDALCKKLKDTFKTDSDAMIGSIKNSIMKSHKRLLKEFSRSVGIELGNDEWDIIGRSNRIRHGEELDTEKTNAACDFYMTYCNRLLLSLLGEKEYHDYCKDNEPTIIWQSDNCEKIGLRK